MRSRKNRDASHRDESAAAMAYHEDPANDVTQRHLAAATYYLLDRPRGYLVPLEICASLGQAHALAALAHIEAEKLERRGR